MFFTICALDAKEDFLFPGLPTALPTVVLWTRSALPGRAASAAWTMDFVVVVFFVSKSRSAQSNESTGDRWVREVALSQLGAVGWSGGGIGAALGPRWGGGRACQPTVTFGARGVKGRGSTVLLLWAQGFLKAGLRSFAFLWVRVSRSGCLLVYPPMEEGQGLQNQRLPVMVLSLDSGLRKQDLDYRETLNSQVLNFPDGRSRHSKGLSRHLLGSYLA